MKKLYWKIGLALAVGILAVLYVLPSVPGMGDSPLVRLVGGQEIHLGLDLKGGIHLTLGVDVDTALENSLVQTGEDLRAEAKDEGILILHPRVEEKTLSFLLLKKEGQSKLQDILKKRFSGIAVHETQEQANGSVRYLVGFTPEYRNHLEKMTLDQAVKTIRNRIDQFGVAEPDIRRQQGNRIQVQLPGIDDTQRAIGIIGRTAHLEFKIVDDGADSQKAEKGIVPAGSQLAWLVRTTAGGQEVREPIVLRSATVLSGKYITDARIAFDSYGQAYVSISFNNRGGKLFERLTETNVHKRLAIVLDGNVHSAPVIQEKISGGQASITGHFSTEEARDLAIVLRAGSLPAPVTVLEERTVGPSLGQESIEAGVRAACIGGVAVLLFMLVYYGIAGLFADIVLVLNILLIMAGLAGFGATLTLPGIAGIILTIGMAVDANVLIFEHIREELRASLPPKLAVEEGFARATLTIVDANITTIIAAIVLYQFGTGPIRGFAVTLVLGILASMFTAIFVSRILFDLWLTRQRSTLAI